MASGANPKRKDKAKRVAAEIQSSPKASSKTSLKVAPTSAAEAAPKLTLKQKKALKRAAKTQELDSAASSKSEKTGKTDDDGDTVAGAANRGLAKTQAEAKSETVKLTLKQKKALKRAAKTQEPDSVASTPASNPGKKRKGSNDCDTVTAAATDDNHLKIFVGGIPFSSDEKAIRKWFAECGGISSLNLQRDDQGRLKGIGFITFKTQDGVAKALELDGSNYDGRTLSVAMATQRKSKAKLSEKGKGKEGKGKGKSNGKDKGKGKDKSKGKGKPKAPSAPGEKPEHCTSIIVKSLQEGVSEDHLYAFFQSCGEGGPTNVRILVSSAGKQLAFVDFDDTDAVDQAIALHGTDLEGRPAHLDYSKPRAHKIW
eukprot:TRINITY_DN4978_c0_g1_i1.p1 TRINITY_DN4978_c0_g1~~TRINITY_DN4978_c0_g1_i1.p1  ORF type:complete len:370 (+),score=91.23 TRINITY_DN4978_c0_g1_i1:156-1265(+)